MLQQNEEKINSTTTILLSEYAELLTFKLEYFNIRKDSTKDLDLIKFYDQEIFKVEQEIETLIYQ